MAFPLVSILIPAYNAQRTLRKAVDSALGQTYPNIEVIVVNDASTDRTAAILAAYGDRIRVIDNVINFGAGRSRDIAFEAACGEWVTYMDADDWLNRSAIAKCMEESESTDIVQMHYYYRTPHLFIPFEWKQRYATHEALAAMIHDQTLFPVQCWGKVYRRVCIESAPKIPYEGFWGDDRLFNLPIMLARPRIAYVPRAIYNYRWGGSTRHGNVRRLIPSFREVASLKREFLHAHSALTPEVSKAIDDELDRLISYASR